MRSLKRISGTVTKKESGAELVALFNMKNESNDCEFEETELLIKHMPIKALK